MAPALIQNQNNQQSESIEQPVPFSHKLHVSKQIECLFCHTKPEPGVQMTYPSTEQCMMCHSSIAADKPSIQKLAKYAADKKPVPWVQIYSVPGFVFWSHGTHLTAGVQCANCHGDVAQMDVIRKTTNVTTMNGCVSCHQQKAAPTGCLTCHEVQSSSNQPSLLSPIDAATRKLLGMIG